MPRIIGGVVLGYLSMVLVVFLGLSAAYLTLGANRAFREGLYDVSPLWIVVSVIVGFVAALLGGWVARRISRSVTGPRALAAVVVVLGVLLVLPVMFGDAAAVGVRDEALGNLEAMQQARTPLWIMLLNPLIGALGVLVGGRAIGAAEDRAAVRV